jgi:hypothetical protein
LKIVYNTFGLLRSEYSHETIAWLAKAVRCGFFEQ